MTDDLTARLERALHVQEQHETDLRPDAAALADLHARVARGRRGRVTTYAAVAAAVVGVVGVAGWFGFQHRTTPAPAPTPTVSTTPSPTPAPTPPPDASAAPAPLVPVELPGLPPMSRAPDGVLDRTGPGWFVALYVSGLYEPVPGDGERRALVLSAPSGELYHLTDVDRYVRPVRWSAPGAVRAETWVGDVRRAATVDLLTGAVTVDERVPVGAQWLGLRGADELWSTYVADRPTVVVVPPDGAARQVPVPDVQLEPSPDGRRVVTTATAAAPEVVDLGTGAVTPLAGPEGQVCTPVAWLDASGVLATCADVVPEDRAGDPETYQLDRIHGRVVRLDATGGAATTLQDLQPDGIVPWNGAHVREGVAVVSAAPLLSSAGPCFDVCYGGAYTWTGRTATPVPLPADVTDEVCEVGAGGDGLLLRTGDLCYEETTGNQWWTVDEATGRVRVVAPAVDSPLGIGAATVVEREAP